MSVGLRGLMMSGKLMTSPMLPQAGTQLAVRAIHLSSIPRSAKYELRGKVAFITGGAQGLGRAYTEALLERGSKVFFGDVNRKTGEATEQELKAKFGGDHVCFSPFDVTHKDEFEKSFSAAIGQFGHVDILVNNAGVMNVGVWETEIGVNFTATVRGTMLALEHMRRDKGGRGGRIINISSVAGLMDHHSFPVYCGTKHAVRSYTSSIASEPGLVENTGVELAVLHPDAADTDLINKLDPTKMHDFKNNREKIEERKMPTSTVVSGLLQLLDLDTMNGAMLLVNKEGATYRRMVPINLGTTWPPPPKAKL